jgi:predicted dienelactone hydrolase
MRTRTAATCRLLALSISTLLAGCASHAPPKADDALVKQFAGRGYLTDDHFGIATSFSSWSSGSHHFDIAWSLPASGKALPLLIYLPGLGESRNAGESWRTAWAQAGYAVLSIQLLDADQQAWSSPAAKRGDFNLLARERYASTATSARLHALAALLGELQKSHPDDDALLQRLDLSRIALAGFDVGAYTALLAAGETPKNNAPAVPLPLPIGAFIALSPYADFSGSALSSRYQAVVAPVLSISGGDDSDALGAVTSPALRQAPFQHMASANAYLLWLAKATHSALAGAPSNAAENAADSDTGRERRQGAEGGGQRKGGRGGKGRAGGGENSGNGGGPGSGGDRTFTLTEQAINANLIQGISTAFLDAHLKHDPIAEEWLRKDASRWIGERGELKKK